MHLAGLPMVGMGTAPGAVLLQFQPVPGVGLVLGCHVIPPLALITGKCQWRSFVASHCRFAPVLSSQFSVVSFQRPVLITDH